MILRNRFEKEINGFMPDMKGAFQQQIAALQADKRRLQGALNNLAGQLAERQLALEFRNRKRLALADLFEGGGNAARSKLNVIDVRERFIFQRPDGKTFENVLPAFLSLGGFTDEALALCHEQDIATADHIAYG